MDYVIVLYYTKCPVARPCVDANLKVKIFYTSIWDSNCPMEVATYFKILNVPQEVGHEYRLRVNFHVIASIMSYYH